jgi:hypothetical protein
VRDSRCAVRQKEQAFPHRLQDSNAGKEEYQEVRPDFEYVGQMLLRTHGRRA